MQLHRYARQAASCLAACAFLACEVYDRDLLADANKAPPPPGDSSVPLADAGPQRDAASSCPTSTEICNHRDDDCDGVVDEQASVSKDCDVRIAHAKSACSTEGTCIYLGECVPGFFNCDGRPETGCESSCPCVTDCVEDAGAEDGGAMSAPGR